MTTIQDISKFLDEFAPLALAEEWDNVGLLLGDPAARADRIITCLTLTEDVADEAISAGANLIVSHHPILFRKIQRITTHNVEGRMLLKLAAAGVAVYSPHTSYDSATGGINRQLAESLGLTNIAPIRELETDSASGSGRCGTLADAMSLNDFIAHVKSSLDLDKLQFVSGDGRTIGKAAVACGSAAEFLRDASRKGCDVLVTGEARFHGLLEARAMGVAMILLGHFASERPAMEHMAEVLSNQFAGVTVTASESETDPLEWA